MHDLRKLDPISRRRFLKRGILAGAFAASRPLWRTLGSKEAEAMFAGKTPELFPFSDEELRKLLAAALHRGGDFADIFFERNVDNDIELDENKISAASRGVEMGAGFRVLNGEKTGFAFSDDLDFQSLKEAAETAALIASGNALPAPKAFKAFKPPSYYLVKVPPDGIPFKSKIDLLVKANETARVFDKRITQISASFSDSIRDVFIVNSEGLSVRNSRTLTTFNTFVFAAEGEKKSSGGIHESGSYGFEHFDLKLAEDIARKACEKAVRLLPAEDAPAGEFPVVIAAGRGGIFFHEAIGHSLEGDFIRKKTSCFRDRKGQLIASPLVNLVDDGSWPGGWGSAEIDDEGASGRKTILIDKGVCAGFLQDRLNARLMNEAPTGNGRRQSHRNFPVPRMTNTYLLAGDAPPEDIIKSVANGIYIASIGGGNVQPNTGRFVFSVDEGYLLEGGRITRPLKGIMLMGSGEDVLKSISLVGHDLKVVGGGNCGKAGQSMPVGFGNPTIKVDKITVGGRKK